MKTKKTLNRREFIGLTVAGSALLLNNTYELRAQPQQYRVRKNVEYLTTQEKDVLKNVVRTMKGLSISNPQNYKGWVKQAEIHKSWCNPSNPNKNVHFTWLFLPWHRAYLYYFEQICRTLPGCSDFTIPYWDWTDPNRRKIPDIFLEEPLLHNRPGINPNNPEASEESVGQSAMTFVFKQDFWGFVGNDPSSSTGNASGNLEHLPHGYIHTGFIKGDMGDALKAAFDPIFWLHHANVDRLWTNWMKQKGTPQNNAWSIKTVEGFYNSDGTLAPKRAVSELLSTYSLGYHYDDQPDKPLKFGNSSKIQKVGSARLWIKGEVGDTVKNIDGVLSVAFSDIFKTAQKSDKSVENIVALIKRVKKINRTKQAFSVSSAALLLIIELEKPLNPEIALRVFINASQNPSELSINSPSYLATISFFEGRHDHDERGINIDNDSRNFIMNVTSKIHELSKLTPSQFVSLEKSTISIVPIILQDKSANIVGGIKLKSLKFIFVK